MWMNVLLTWTTVNTTARITLDHMCALVGQDSGSTVMGCNVLVRNNSFMSFNPYYNYYSINLTIDLFLTDIDECIAGTDNCGSTCSNTIGSYVCSCLTGYRLQSDGSTCRGNNSNIVIQPVYLIVVSYTFIPYHSTLHKINIV